VEKGQESDKKRQGKEGHKRNQGVFSPEGSQGREPRKGKGNTSGWAGEKTGMGGGALSAKVMGGKKTNTDNGEGEDK